MRPLQQRVIQLEMSYVRDLETRVFICQRAGSKTSHQLNKQLITNLNSINIFG